MASTRPVFKSINRKQKQMVASALQACTSFKQVKQVHALVFVSGLAQNPITVAKLLNTYAICGGLHTARLLFDSTPSKSNNIYLWNVMIRNYVKIGEYEETLRLYYLMQQSGVQADHFTYPYVLKACTSLGALKNGREIHYHICQDGINTNVYVGAALIDMYAKCSSMEDARHVFNKMPERNVVLWTSMIAGYAQNGQSSEALKLFNEMVITDVKPNSVTVISVLPPCAHLGDLKQGKTIHNYIITNGFGSEVIVGNALVAMYANCGCMEIAHKKFDEMSHRDVVSWNAVVAGYVQNGQDGGALEFFNQMQLSDVKADSFTVASLLPACAHLEALQQGKWIHGYAVKSGFEGDGFVAAVVIDMYIKCGSLEDARQAFDKMQRKDTVCWSLMIASYDYRGYPREALKLFHQMQVENVKPNTVTMASVLSACSHSGGLQHGKWIHVCVIRCGFESDVSVGNSLVAMHAKCGSMESASHFFDNMSKRNTISWNAMILDMSKVDMPVTFLHFLIKCIWRM